MKHKIKYRLIGWMLLILIIISGLICSCEHEQVRPVLQGSYETKNLSLDYKDSIFFAITNGYKIEGQYKTFDNDSIKMKISWKKHNIQNEYNICILAELYKYELFGDKLILSGSDYEIILNTVK